MRENAISVKLARNTMSTGQDENFCIEVPPSVSTADREKVLSTGTLKGTPGTQCSPLQ